MFIWEFQYCQYVNAFGPCSKIWFQNEMTLTCTNYVAVIHFLTVNLICFLWFQKYFAQPMGQLWSVITELKRPTAKRNKVHVSQKEQMALTLPNMFPSTDRGVVWTAATSFCEWTMYTTKHVHKWGCIPYVYIFIIKWYNTTTQFFTIIAITDTM